EWELTPAGPGGKKLSAIVPSCERSEMQLAFSRSSNKGSPPAPTPLPVLAPRPGNCHHFSGLVVDGTVYGWQGGQLGVIAGGQLLWSGGREQQAEQPIAWGTSFGLAVTQGDTVSLWTGELSRNAHHCAVAPRLEKVACIRGDSVYVMSEASPSSGQ